MEQKLIRLDLFQGIYEQIQVDRRHNHLLGDSCPFAGESIVYPERSEAFKCHLAI
jgi:hypothetical protein